MEEKSTTVCYQQVGDPEELVAQFQPNVKGLSTRKVSGRNSSPSAEDPCPSLETPRQKESKFSLSSFCFIQPSTDQVKPAILEGFPGGASDKEPTCQCRRCKRQGCNLQVRKILWRRAWQPSPVFLPGESHGKRSLVGCSPQGHKQLDMTNTYLLTYITFFLNLGLSH